MTLQTFDIDGLPVSAEALLDLMANRLRAHHGRGNPAKGAAIARALSITQQNVAALRRLAWARGIPIGSCGKGYYFAFSPDDFEDTIAHTRQRAQAAETNLRWCQSILQELRRNQMQLRGTPHASKE